MTVALQRTHDDLDLVRLVPRAVPPLDDPRWILGIRQQPGDVETFTVLRQLVLTGRLVTARRAHECR
jgi:hypothetical protein